MYLESKASPYDTNICDSAEFDFVENIDQVVPQTEMDTTDFANEDVPLCEDISIEEALVGSIDLILNAQVRAFAKCVFCDSR